MSNLQTVQDIYAAFGAGDVPTILSKLADDVDWEYSASTDVPWLQRRHGREAVAGFFEALGALQANKFEPKELLESGNTVVAVIDIDFTVRANGKPIREEDELHLWRFNGEGKVVRFKHGADSYMHQRAFKGS